MQLHFWGTTETADLAHDVMQSKFHVEATPFAFEGMWYAHEASRRQGLRIRVQCTLFPVSRDVSFLSALTRKTEEGHPFSAASMFAAHLWAWP
eukprot:3069232-Amphidinium_carterae.1